MLRRRGLFLAAAAAALAMVAGTKAEAAFGDFTYQTTLTPASYTVSTPPPFTTLTNAGAGDLTTTFNAAAPGGTDLTAGTLTAMITLSSPGATDTYSTAGTSLTVFIDDKSHSVTFNATTPGNDTISESSTGVSAATYVNPFGTAQSKDITIGNTIFTVSLIPTKDFSAPGAPPVGAGSAVGTYSINVSAKSVPEPASMALLGLGGLGALGVFRRRRSA